ncbi:ADP-ribosylglycohydrolase family protein [candidate division CSSED10-310 bacterium]|uniref:ADP-ribosylglycohydrolase family protein n=1 Tax=candidate division CSSED10-310 bacterium TaxID=2855610 RepID=A0ABV6YXE7_UNCC1
MDINKIKGMLFGLAIGDSMGRPTEFMTLAEIKQKYGPSGIQELPDPALYTDDTQMTIAIAEALVKADPLDVETIMHHVQAEFITWYHSPENNRAPGTTCLQGVENIEKGTPWNQSGIADSMGCGSAMRVAPVGYIFQHDPEMLRTVAHATGICTHGHRGADAACIGAAWLIKCALDHIPIDQFIPSVLEFTKGISPEFTQSIQKVKECLTWDDEEQALEYLGEGWIGPEAVALALYCFLRYPDDYKKAILRGANTNGDSDSIACIAGGISGAYLGIDAISHAWTSKIEKSKYLGELAKRLATVEKSIL